MATYKVLQDIEAEDKLLGPLTFRQFVYAGVCIANLYFSFLVITHHAPFLVALFLPIAGLSGFFAWPWGGDQPTEVWALAKVRFIVKPRKRIWDQSGVKELVSITVPKRLDPILTNGLSQNEVYSRLRVLADTIDSRGWAIKNVNVNLYSQPSPTLPQSDRLVGPSAFPQEVPTMDIRASDDILDEQNNPVAQQFDTMIQQSEQAHRQRVIDQLKAEPLPAPAPVTTPAPAALQTPAQPPQIPTNNYWFLNQPSQPVQDTPQDMVTFNTQVVTPGTPATAAPVVAVPADDQQGAMDEQQLLAKLREQDKEQPTTYSHLHTIQPLSQQRAPARQHAPAAPQSPANQRPKSAEPPVTRARNAAILDLVSNNDLNVATIAREAHKRQEPPQDEVVISLH